MNQIIDINDLGTEYAVYNNNGDNVTTIKLIWNNDILGSALGEYNESFYDGYDDYMNSSISMLRGFVEDIYSVSWYVSTEEDFDLHEAIELAIAEGNNIVVLETVYESEYLYIDETL